MTLVITEGANWNDGMPLTMDDWLFTFQFNQDNADKGISWSSFLTGVEWRAEGSDTIIFTLPEPNWRFHYNFGGRGTFTPVPKHVWEGQDPSTFKNPDAIHSGPYRLVSSNADTRTTIWERRDDYWDPDRMPAPKYQVWLKRPEADVAVFEWEEGNFDLGRLPFSLMTRIMSGNPHIKPLVHQDPCPRGLVFNTTSVPLDDKLFRRALGLLLNRKAVANLANVPSYVTPVLWPNDGSPDETYFDAAAAEEFQVTTFDPEAAAALLDEAGYPLVDGARVDKDGNAISLDAFYIDIGDPAWTVWAWLLSEQAQLIGLEINPRLLDIPTFFTQAPNGEFDILFRWFCTLPNDPITLFEGLHSDYAVPIGERSSGIPGRYSNPEMDALIEQLRVGNPASEESQALFRQAYRIWAEDQPYLAMFGENEGVVFNSEHWTGLAVGQPWVHWTPAARQIIDFLEPAG
jgi:peptide/nickel transport system substrate-binding protein